MPDNRQLNVIDADDHVIGVDTRDNIHQQGLLHREAHVWFYTPRGELVFQHRAKDKDTYPDLLDATVGGHVEIGADYLQTALQETAEETGLQLTEKDLVFIRMVRSNTFDPVTAKTNNAIRAIYAYRYDGRPEDLRVEPGKAVGFEAVPLEKVFTLSDQEKKRFIPSVFDQGTLNIFQAIKQRL